MVKIFHSRGAQLEEIGVALSRYAGLIAKRTAGMKAIAISIINAPVAMAQAAVS